MEVATATTMLPKVMQLAVKATNLHILQSIANHQFAVPLETPLKIDLSKKWKTT